MICVFSNSTPLPLSCLTDTMSDSHPQPRHSCIGLLVFYLHLIQIFKNYPYTNISTYHPIFLNLDEKQNTKLKKNPKTKGKCPTPIHLVYCFAYNHPKKYRTDHHLHHAQEYEIYVK